MKSLDIHNRNIKCVPIRTITHKSIRKAAHSVIPISDDGMCGMGTELQSQKGAF